MPRRAVILYADTSDVHRSPGLSRQEDLVPDFAEPLIPALSALGYSTRTLGVSYDTLDRVRTIDADLVVNLVDGVGSDGVPGVEIPALLARREIPFTGCSANAYALTSDKLGMRRRLEAVGIELPPLNPHPSEERPAFVKPRYGYASIGVDARSIATSTEAVSDAVARLRDEYGMAALVESYVEGREFSVAVIGRHRALPVIEVHFRSRGEASAPIRTEASKHDEGHWDDVQIECPARIPSSLAAELQGIALRACAALDVDGYARVDFRCADDGRPYVLEVNANPSLEIGPTLRDCALLPIAAFTLGWQTLDLVRALVMEALERRLPRPGPRAALRWVLGERSLVALDDVAPGDIVLHSLDMVAIPREELAPLISPVLRIDRDHLVAAASIREGQVLSR